MRGDNYPDDIRKYDDDPRSPFYNNLADESREAYIEAHAEELAGDWKREIRETGIILDLGWELADWRDAAEIEQPQLWERGEYQKAMDITLIDAAERDVEINIETLMEREL